jgi:hypothetical protein
MFPRASQIKYKKKISISIIQFFEIEVLKKAIALPVLLGWTKAKEKRDDVADG